MLFKTMTNTECFWPTTTMLESDLRNPKLCLRVTFVECLPVVKGGVMIDIEEAPSKEKTGGRGLADSF